MEKQPYLGLLSGQEALDELRKFPLPVGTGILHIPDQELTWPMLVPQGGVHVRLAPGDEQELTYGMVTGLVVFEDTFHLIGRVDYALRDAEHTALFRLEWNADKAMLESIGELGILVLSDEVPPKFAGREELVTYLSNVPTFVCQLDEQELHRLRVQMIRMNAQAQFLTQSNSAE
ncbi:hypothetical protein [Tumebacillus flagellatus]|uniref:Uncharacterized protein n=1 Tax=Tumebacillus flagellatus TaxID=1157490 RepID=A0A074LSV8_9BACL|nr:hypothetical protein [Tumebacillus flagellatus]KEO83570.1 hypothetical protein EL26_09160 [Tumebacillus flagellatus]